MIGPKTPKLTAAQERAAYAAVTERDQGRCVRCGRAGDVERDHRQNRDAYNTVVSNLQLLGGPFGCGCHQWKTENPAAAILEGFAVPRWGSPEWWPAWRADVRSWVLYFDVPDSQGRWWTEITPGNGRPTHERRDDVNCFPGKVHRFDRVSGYCLHGCGVRDDGHVLNKKGDVIYDGPQYTPDELAEMRRRIDPSGED